MLKVGPVLLRMLKARPVLLRMFKAGPDALKTLKVGPGVIKTKYYRRGQCVENAQGRVCYRSSVRV